VADVADLLALKRGHWGIENQLHWVRAVVFGEDDCLTRKGEAPLVLSALRNTLLNLLRKKGHNKICPSLRSNASNPDQVLALPGLTPSA
jgi:predicted transposase YbfD/YdcC